MKKFNIYSKILIFLIASCGLLAIALPVENFRPLKEIPIAENLELRQSLSIGYIHIDNNFTETPWCQGQGTPLNPYIIENITINGLGRETCVLIKNTREYFEIRNCTITSAEIGIKIVNATNFKIVDSEISDLRGTDGADGPSDVLNNAGMDGNASIGILLIDCVNSNITSNVIRNIQGGAGGNGGKGLDGGLGAAGNQGGSGGEGGASYGIMVNTSKELYISHNYLYNITGGDGGQGGEGGEGGGGNIDESISPGNGGKGGDAGSGGSSIALYVEKSQDIVQSWNEIIDIISGTGDIGGIGGDGGFAPATYVSMGGYGGKGGKGGRSSLAAGFYTFNSSNVLKEYNAISNISSGEGGKGGDGGDSPPCGMSQSGGAGNEGGNTGDVSGILIAYSQDCLNLHSLIRYIKGGLAGDGGNGGESYGSAIDGGSPGGKGGSGGYITGIFISNSNNTHNYNNSILQISDGISGNGGNATDCDSAVSPGGLGGPGGNGGVVNGMYLHCSKNTTNILNLVNQITFGTGGLGGTGGTGSSGQINGSFGINGTACGMTLLNSNNSKSYFNAIYCQNNTDTGYFNEWDNGNAGNFWSHYIGSDISPRDGFGDTPHVLNYSTGAQDNYPFIDFLDGDLDGDGLDNLEESTTGIDNYITNMTDADTDHDTFSDYVEWECSTHPVDPYWFPMPNLKVGGFYIKLNETTQEVHLMLSVENNGIWRAENINVIVTCEAHGIVLLNEIIDLEIDETKLLYVVNMNCTEIDAFFLNATIDPVNSINESYSSKDGSFRPDSKADNNLILDLSDLNGNTADNNDILDDGFAIITIATLSITSIILGAGFILFWLKRRNVS